MTPPRRILLAEPRGASCWNIVLRALDAIAADTHIDDGQREMATTYANDIREDLES